MPPTKLGVFYEILGRKRHKKCLSVLQEVIYKTDVAGAVLQPPSLLINSLIQSVSHPFPPSLQNTFPSKPFELRT